MEKELITVIINVYNREKFISKCLDSVINQTYKHLEILIINDGSTDNTLKICESYKDSRIRIITTKNRGLALSRNVGIENSNGKYLYFIDSDDFVELDTIEYLYNSCIEFNCAISTCKMSYTYDYEFRIKNKKEKIRCISKEDMLNDILLSKNFAVSICNKLINKDLFENLRFEDRIINDMAFTYKLIMKSDNIACSNQVKYYYLRHSKSITAQKASLERMIDVYEVFVDRYYYIKNVYPNYAENDFAILQIIVKLYLKENVKIQEYLEKQGAVQLFKKIFSLRIFKCNVKVNEKIKILLFRINPKFNKLVVDSYLKLKKII